MAFVHCHDCGWAQDDFWSRSYNPVPSVKRWECALLSEGLDEHFTDDAAFIRKHGNLTRREVIAREFESAAKTIREMLYRTEAELRERNPDRICPKCGETLDVD